MLREELPRQHLEGSLVHMLFGSFPLGTSDLVYTKPPFGPVEAHFLSELTMPLVYYFCPSETSYRGKSPGQCHVFKQTMS